MNDDKVVIVKKDSNQQAWEKTGLLEGYPDKDKAKLAALLENQRVFNTAITLTEECKIDRETFKRLTIPLVARFMKEFVFFNLISHETLIAPTGKFKYKDLTNNAIKDMEIVAKSRFMKLRWNQDKLNELYEQNQSRIGAEMEFLDGFNESFQLEIQQEIYKDLSNNSGSVSDVDWKNINNLVDAILIKSSSIEKKIGKSANWIIVPVEIFEELKNSSDFTLQKGLNNSSKLQKVGRLSNKWDVYVNPIVEDLEIVLGYKEEMNTGYVYCPFILIGGVINEKLPIGEDYQTPYPIDDPLPTDHKSIIGRVNEYAMITRYGKKLINKDNYAKIVISGYSFKKN